MYFIEENKKKIERKRYNHNRKKVTQNNSQKSSNDRNINQNRKSEWQIVDRETIERKQE